MKHFCAGTLFLTSLILGVSQRLTAAEAGKPRVAVLEFKNNDSLYKWNWYEAGRAIQEMFSAELDKRGTFRVVKREHIQSILETKGLPGPVGVEPKITMQIGELLGADYIVTGTVVRLGSTTRQTTAPEPGGGRIVPRRGQPLGTPPLPLRAEKLDTALEARAFSTSTGEMVWTHTLKESRSTSEVADARGSAADEARLNKLVRPTVIKLVDSLSERRLATIAPVGIVGAAGVVSKASAGTGDTAGVVGKATRSGDLFGIVGKIAKADGRTIYVNVGFEARIEQGAEFNVYRAAEQIKDPDTGEVLGVRETKIGRVKITSVEGPRLSIAEPVSGTGFMAGDRLKN